jgi:RNA polymerase sigma factor (sigma-70 family)
MSQGQSSPVLRFIRRVRSTTASVADSDSALLDRFVKTRSEEAFVALMERHGGMVLSVCRQVLQNLHDTEDAFQATFLVLARRAGTIHRRASLASCLYGVALRVARKAQTAKVCRRARERRAADDRPKQMSPDDAWRELRTILDDELDRLPEKYRAPLVLCYLEGKTNEQAAQQLGWTKGTVSGRLARARDLLRARLTRRGLTLSAGMMVGLFGAGTAPAAVPGTLRDATVRAAASFAARKAVAAQTPAVLAEGVMRAMVLGKYKVVLILIMSLVLTGSAGLLARALTAAAPDTETAAAAVSVSGKSSSKAELERRQGIGAPPGIDMSHNSPELVRASVAGDLATVRKLVESGADLNSTDEHGMGPLLTFTPSVTQYLLSKGADPDRQKNESGCPVLIGVAYMNNLECVRLLLEGGADPNAVNECGETALHSSLAHAGEHVSAADRQAVVQLLIKHGADPNRRTIPGMVTLGFWRDTRTRGETPLHRAAAYASEETVKFLLAAGADKTIRDANGDSPQSWASWHWRPKDLIFLLDPHGTR